MELAKELFDQIVGALGEARLDQPSGAGAEKRRSPRVAITADVAVAPFGVRHSRQRTVKLRSLSRSGAAVLDGLAMQAGEKIVLHLPRAGGEPIPIVCVVKNSRLCGGAFRIGMEFLSRNEDTASTVLRSANGVVQRPVTEGPLDVLDAIAEGKPFGNMKASGRDARIEINVQALLSPYANGHTGPMSPVTVKDISPTGGVCIIQPEPMERGEQFLLQIPRKNGKPLTMICTVADCRRLDNTYNYRIGARFELTLRMDADADANPSSVLARLRRWFAA